MARDNLGDNRGYFNGHILNARNNNIGYVSQIIPIESGVAYRTLVCDQDAEMMTFEMQANYDVKAFMSYDGLFRPVSMDGDGGLPRFCQVIGQPPNEIYIEDLNPWTNPSGFPRDHVSSIRSNTPDVGHDLDMVGRIGGDYENTPSGGLIMYPSWWEQTGGTGSRSDHYSDYTDDYRFMALRGPLVIHGWGYDCSGIPIPNQADVYGDAVSGIFKDEGLHPNKFIDNHLHNPRTWPVAPVDLRFDRNRCVWTACGTGQQIDCDSIKETFGYDTEAGDGYKYALIFNEDQECDICRIIKCGEVIIPEGEMCSGCDTAVTPLGFNLNLDNVDATGPPSINKPDGDYTLQQLAGNDCEFEGEITLVNNSSVNETFTWELSYATNTWTLRLRDVSDTTIISFNTIAKASFDCLGDNLFTGASVTPSQLSSSYDFSSATFTVGT